MERIVLVADPEDVLRLKAEKGVLAAGEVGGRVARRIDMPGEDAV